MITSSISYFIHVLAEENSKNGPGIGNIKSRTLTDEYIGMINNLHLNKFNFSNYIILIKGNYPKIPYKIIELKYDKK